jgi:type III pantothenate kinase
MVSSDLSLGIQVRTDAPHETGTDRIANCAAAYARFGGPVIVVDVGTATKIEAVTAGGEFLGGVIAPGPAVTLEALASRAARLYAVELRLPETAIGRNTVAAVQSGVVAGHLALIEGMVSRVRDELGGAQHVVLTGGFAEIFAPAKSCITDYVPDLTLRGLRLIWHWNRNRVPPVPF